MWQRKSLLISIALIELAGVPTPACSGDYPSSEFQLKNVVFDDGGQAAGTFQFNWDASKQMPLPQFYNIHMTTSQGTVLSGSYFSSVRVCYNNNKKFVCAPNDNLLISVEVGTPGDPGYDHFQFATFFAPQALVGSIGVLDPIMSYETACYAPNVCVTRHVVAGAIRL